MKRADKNRSAGSRRKRRNDKKRQLRQAMNKMMKCGCAANCVLSSKGGVTFDPPIPGCGIHDCFEEAPELPNLEGRMAKCSYGCNPVPSKITLAFFKHHPDKEFDEYYCGCYGWD